jgi:hypothetical protein
MATASAATRDQVTMTRRSQSRLIVSPLFA